MQSQTGAYIITTLITAPSTGDLALLANVKDELGVSDGTLDTRLKRFISEESAGISRYCNRIFGRAVWFDQFRPHKGIWGEGTRAATNLHKCSRKYPLIAQPVPFLGNTTLNSQTVSGIPSTAGLAECQPVFGPGITPGTAIEGVLSTQRSYRSAGDGRGRRRAAVGQSWRSGDPRWYANLARRRHRL